MISINHLPSWQTLLIAYASVEVAFYFIFSFHLKPRANRRTKPTKFRDYGRQRHRLLLRILDRMERTCRATKRNIHAHIENFLNEWFQKHPSPLLEGTPPSSPEVSEDERSTASSDEYSLDTLRKEDVDDVLSWAFFGKHVKELDDWEASELDKMYSIIQKRYNLVFEPGKSTNKTARLLTLEDVRPLHRPLLVYAIFGFLEMMGNMVLFWHGFRRHVAKSGLVYWHCPSRLEQGDEKLPLLFFHGIAPAGKTFYIPMLLYGLGAESRDVFIFENRPITSALCFHALTEEETVAGVAEALDAHLEPNVGIALCGHSFGSCQLTWLLQSALRSRIRQIVLADPVTINLSEPDVMVNFLYSRHMEAPVLTGSFVTRFKAWIHRKKIEVLASSELFTEHYLRRHFSWYNSELWLEDIPSDIQVLVCLAELDEIVNARKVKKEIELHNERRVGPQIKLLHLEDVGHARCITSPKIWRQLSQHVCEQEEKIKVC